MNNDNQARINSNNEIIAFLTAKNVKLEAEKKPGHHLLTTVEDGRFTAQGDGISATDTDIIPRARYQKQGRLFATAQECENFIAKEAAIVRINRAILLANGDWVTDWKDSKEDKYSLYYNHNGQKWGVTPGRAQQNSFTFMVCYSRKPLEKIIADRAADFALVVGGV